MEAKKYTMDLAGHKLSLEFGKYCEQAAGSVWVSLDDTVVMVNATMSPVARPGVDFFPLAVDVEEKQYAAGKIPGGFIKREGRPTEKATLTCRLIDRPLRPLFPKGMRNDVQVVATILSVDKCNPPEIPAMIGSSIALAVSDIPWGGPTGSVVVGLVDGEIVTTDNGYMITITEYSYDSQGRLVKESSPNSNSRTEYTYSDGGKLETALIYGENGELTNKRISTYDDYGNMLLQETYDAVGNVMLTTTLSYISTDGRTSSGIAG